MSAASRPSGSGSQISGNDSGSGRLYRSPGGTSSLNSGSTVSYSQLTQLMDSYSSQSTITVTASYIRFVFVKNPVEVEVADRQHHLDYSFDATAEDIKKLAKHLKRTPRNGDINVEIIWVDTPEKLKLLYDRPLSKDGKECDRPPKPTHARSGSPIMDCGDSQEDFDCATYFIIGSFETALYTNLSRDGQKIMSPLVFGYWRQMFEANPNAFDLRALLARVHTPVGLFSECMHDAVVYISKVIMLQPTAFLAQRIKMMGGFVELQFNIRVTHVVIEDQVVAHDPQGSVDPVIKAAHFFQVPVVKIGWIENAWKPLQYQLKFADEILFVKMYTAEQRLAHVVPKLPPVLVGKTIGVLDNVCFNPKNNLLPRKDALLFQFHETVLKFAGKFVVQSMDTQNKIDSVDILVHIEDIGGWEYGKMSEIYQKYDADRKFRALKEKRPKLPLLRVDWLLKTLVSETLQPMEEFHIRYDDGDEDMDTLGSGSSG